MDDKTLLTNKTNNIHTIKNEDKNYLFNLHLSTAIVSAICLRDLYLIRYYYPDVLNEKEAKELHNSLVELYESAIKDEKLDYVKGYYEPQDYNDLSAYYHFKLSIGMLLLSHPYFKSDVVGTDKFMKVMKKAISESQKNVEKSLSLIVENLQKIILFNCRIPNPKDDKTYKESGRYFYLLTTYWNLIGPLLQYEMNAYAGYYPHPLLKIILNIRSRLEVCFEHLGDFEGNDEALNSFTTLMDILLSTERDDLGVVPECTNDLISKIEIFIAQNEIKFFLKSFSLTRIENCFIEFTKDLITEYIENNQDDWNKILESLNSRFPNDETDNKPIFQHSPDYRSVNKKGKIYSLTPNEAVVVKILHEAFMNGTPDMSQHYILEDIESPQKRLRDVINNKEVWKELIEPGKTKGTYRLK